MSESGTRTLSLRQRIVDFVARLHRDPPECGVCETKMRWMDGAWDCPNLYRDDHRFETEDGGVGFTTRGGHDD